jgi:hypothetical protein
MATYTWVDAEVFASAAAPVAFTDLDITVDTSALPTGLTGRAWALIEVVVAGATSVYFKPGGDPTDWRPPADLYSRGTTVGAANAANGEHFVCLVQTSSDGKIAWRADVANNVQLILLSFIDAPYEDTALATPGLVATPTWNLIDASPTVGATEAIVLVQLLTTGYVDEEIGTRPVGDTDGNFLATGNLTAGTARTRTPSAAEAGSILAVTDATGAFELGLSAATSTVTYSDLSHVLKGAGMDVPASGTATVFQAAAPPLAYTDLDLSSAVGAQRAAVVLKVRHGSDGTATSTDFAFRPKGKAGSWRNASINANGIQSALMAQDSSALAVALTDADGIVEWISIPSAGTSNSTALSVVGWLGLGGMTITSIRQSTLNTVDLVFSEEPNHLDPVNPDDAFHIPNYTVTGPVSPLPERLIQAVSYEGDNTVRLWFDGPLVPDEIYNFSITDIEGESGNILVGEPILLSLTAFGADRVPVPLQQDPRQSWDIRNPQSPDDAPQNAPLGTFVLNDDGDLDIETKRQYLRKRIFRRLGTRKGAMYHLPEYGLELADKTLYTGTTLRQLQQEVESQISLEPDVVSVRASAQQLLPGVVIVKIVVSDRFGSFDMTDTLGGGDA